MLTVIFMIQCDVCGELCDKVRSSNQADPTLWSLLAGDLQDSCGTEDYWFFNSKIRKHWCLDCRSEWEERAVPAIRYRPASEDNRDCDF
jgi:hypothetical protein